MTYLFCPKIDNSVGGEWINAEDMTNHNMRLSTPKYFSTDYLKIIFLKISAYVNHHLEMILFFRIDFVKEALL